MTVRTRFGACILLGCSLAATGCAQPSLWSKFSGGRTLGSPAERAPAPAAATTANRRAAAPTSMSRQDEDALFNSAEEAALSRSSAKGNTASRTSSSSSLSSQRTTAANMKSSKDSKDKGPSEHAIMSLSRLNEKKGNAADAETGYREVLNRNPKNAMAWQRMGIISAGKGNFDDAEKCFVRYEQLGEVNSEYLSNKGYCRYLEHRLEEAESVLREAAQMDRENYTAVNNLGLVLGAQERFDEALACFKKAGNDAQAYANLAYVYTQLGELEHAEAHYLHALTLDKNMKTATNALMQVHEKRQHLSMKKPPTSLAVRPNLDGDSEQVAEVEAPLPGSRGKVAAQELVIDAELPPSGSAEKAAAVALAAIEEPISHSPAKTRAANKSRTELAAETADASESTDLPVDEVLPAAETRATELADIESPATESPLAEIPAPKSLSTNGLRQAKLAVKPALPPAESNEQPIVPVRHERSYGAAKVEAVQAVNVDEAVTAEATGDETLPPVVTRAQYNVRRTSAEAPLAPLTTKTSPGINGPASVKGAAVKSLRFDYSGTGDATAQPRRLRDIFKAP